MITTHDLRIPALARSALGSALCWVGKYDEAGENGDFIAYGFNQCALAELCRLGFSGWSASFVLGWSNKHDSNNDNGGTGSQSTPCRAYRQVELRPRIPSSNLPWVIGELALLRNEVDRTMPPGDEGRSVIQSCARPKLPAFTAAGLDPPGARQPLMILAPSSFPFHSSSSPSTDLPNFYHLK
ncbi:hypothetical protein CF319_g8106 [Tilletia indica]|nr:hypothetical protein CF319_g8106 [Tilletia indica]